MRVAALDFGKVRIGLAICDELGLMSHPRPALDGRDRKRAIGELRRLVETEDLERFVVGIPLDSYGLPGPAARKAQAFAAELAQATGLPVDTIDERLTTVEATRRLREGGMDARKSRAHVDSASACILLQTWLDARRPEER